MKVFVDLFSGLGGASAAFDEDPTWTTIKIDNNEELLELNRGLILMDITDWEAICRMIENMLNGNRIERLVIWASPPCQQFSWALPARTRGQTSEDFDLTLFDATTQIIEHFRVKFPSLMWVIENVHGAKPIFNEELELYPRQEIGSVVLWGDFPLIPIADRTTWKHRKLEAKGSRTLRPNYRAIIPRPISDGLLSAIDRQTTLAQWS